LSASGTAQADGAEGGSGFRALGSTGFGFFAKISKYLLTDEVASTSAVEMMTLLDELTPDEFNSEFRQKSCKRNSDLIGI
jgi:hypothetical protein